VVAEAEDDVVVERAFGAEEEITATAGETCSTPFGPTVAVTGSPVVAQIESTLAVLSSTAGMKRLSHAHQVHSRLPSTWKACGGISLIVSPQKPIT